MPSMESFFMQTRKQELSCGRGVPARTQCEKGGVHVRMATVPALKSVGDAWVNQRSESKL